MYKQMEFYIYSIARMSVKVSATTLNIQCTGDIITTLNIQCTGDIITTLNIQCTGDIITTLNIQCTGDIYYTSKHNYISCTLYV